MHVHGTSTGSLQPQTSRIARGTQVVGIRKRLPPFAGLDDHHSATKRAAVPHGPTCSRGKESKLFALPRRIWLGGISCFVPLSMASIGQASKLGPGVDRAWEAVGGGPADLYFPEQFEGEWAVESVLQKVDTPLGPEFVPDMRVVGRALSEDLNQSVRYRVSFMRNGGHIVSDRAFNTARLMELYLGGTTDCTRRITWNPQDPNVLTLDLPGGVVIRTRVTRRSLQQAGPGRLDTSEFVEQVFDSPERNAPKVKASQCFTKYRFRSESAAQLDGGPAIVATQVVSDYLTPYDDPGLLLQAAGKPVVLYTYRMSFTRPTVREMDSL